MTKRGRPRTYKSAAKLDRAVENYFDSITYTEPVTKLVETGEKDKFGHDIFKAEPVINKLGQEITRTVYAVPPTVGGLCAYLGISEDTWERYAELEEYCGTITRARGRMKLWNENELLTRDGRDVKGIIFNLENNYGYSEKQSLAVEGVEDYLRKQTENGSAPEW